MCTVIILTCEEHTYVEGLFQLYYTTLELQQIRLST